MSNNSKNSSFYQVTSHTVVPAPSTKTGTITAAGKNITGTNTLFVTEVKKGDWIVDIANDEARKIMQVRDNTFLTIDSAFSNAIAGAALVVVRSRVKRISIANVGNATATVDGVNFVSGESVTYGKAEKLPNGSDFIDPIFVNGTSSALDIQTLK